jgi:hypothetical protein
MARISWKRFFAWFASAAIVVAAGMTVRGDDAEACSGWEPSIADLTTFDPGVLGDDVWAGLDYDPFTAGYGGPCFTCQAKAMADDWHGFLGDPITVADWDQVLNKATLKDIFAIEQFLKGKTKTVPKGFEQSSLWKATDTAKLYDAVEFVELLTRMGPQVTFEPYDGKPRPAAGQSLEKELKYAKGGLKAAKEPFLQQRYAFVVMRALFYRQEWAAAIAFHDKNLATLSAPSEDIKWRARWYLAGALRKDGKRARANVELARIHAGYMPLSGMAMFDFAPDADSDWKDSLRLAKNPQDKTALWRMVGIKDDPLVAAQEIVKLDPKSPLIGVLVIREIGQVESQIARTFNSKPDPKEVAAQKKGYARIEAFATKLAVAPATAKPYVYELVLAHIASKRGDLANARLHASKAVAEAPGDARVASQAKASVAIALAANWKMTAQNEEEVAQLMTGVDPGFGRITSVRDEVRTKLAIAYAAANKMIDAEFLAAPVQASSEDDTGVFDGKIKTQWQSVAFLKAMIARTDQRTTAFDRFVLESSHVKEDLQLELAVRLTLDGDFTGAKTVFATSKAKSQLLRTDPFVIHVIDCHDCDIEKLGEKSKWTHKNLVDRLAELELTAKGGGEQGAQAALAIGNALYNITHHGNARTFAAETHQATANASLAERYYKKVYDSSGNRELKAKAAWLAAKAELGTMIDKEEQRAPNTGVDDGLMVPKVWFPIFAKFSNTRYYKEVLAECGRFRSYAQTR